MKREREKEKERGDDEEKVEVRQYVVDDLISQIIAPQEQYERAMIVYNNLMEQLHLQQISPEKEVKILHQIWTGLTSVLGVFHSEIYRVRGMLLTALLIIGDTQTALQHCLYLVSYQLLTLHLTPSHPLLGLQLFTLGDLYREEGHMEEAKKTYEWTKEILQVAYGPDSDFVQRINQCLSV